MQFAREVHKDQVRKYMRRDLSAEVIQSEADREMKLCSGCETEKSFAEFNKSNRARHGLHNHCRACQQVSRRRFYEANRESEIASTKAGRATARAAWKARYVSDPEFKAKVLEYNRARRRTDQARKLANEAKRRNEEAFPSAKIARNLRVRLRKAVVGVNRAAATMDLLGCSIDEFKTHLERQFEPGMSWDNYGYHGWHIDHIRPCASFDLTDQAQQYECFNFRNTRPAWRFDNQSKGGRLLLDVLTKADPRLLEIARAQAA
jgi:hypothetical protein